MRALSTPTVDAVLGRATDGGYWSIGLKRHGGSAFATVPMSCSTTWTRQRDRLRALGLRVHQQPALSDVDTIARRPAPSPARLLAPGLPARSRRWRHDPSAAALR